MSRSILRSTQRTRTSFRSGAHDALGDHAHDEPRFYKEMRARPVQTALASAASFAAGGIVPL